MSKIIIGQEYENEFKSICALYTGGFLSKEVHIKSIRGLEITTNTHTFEYRADEHGVNGSGEAENALTFTSKGSSWFAPLRGVEFDSGNSDWKQLIMDVAADYHKNYSLIEFKQSKDNSSLSTEKKLLNKFKKGFIDRVFDDGKAFTIIESRSTMPENFYAVSMRLEINGGGESAPLLGKIYFKETTSFKLVPLTNREAEKIDKFIDSAIPFEDGSVSDGEIVDVSLVGRVFSGLENAFKSGDFASYVSFDDKYKRAIDAMLAQLATSEVKDLECTNVKVLGVSHVEWDKSVYAINYRGKEVLRAVVGLNGVISLYCVNCGVEDALIDGNIIAFKDGKINANCNAVLDFSQENLGLISSDIDEIKANGVISDHLFTVNCRENSRNKECFRVVCKQQTIELDNGMRKCKGCRYPEIIYKDIFSERYDEGGYTPDLNFATDRLSLVAEPIVKCRCCGREFTMDNTARNRLCAFCADVDHSENAVKLYRKYANMLSLGNRFFHLFAKKYCREDANIILFELGVDRYVFDKIEAEESGFIKAPKKVRRTGGI